MKKVGLIAVLALGGLLLCSTAAIAQDTSTNNAGNSGTEGKQGKRRFPTVEQRVDRMSKELNLTDEQKPKVKAVLEDQDKKMRDLTPEERRGKFREMREETNKKLKDILTPDQYTKWETNRAQFGRRGKKSSQSQ